MQTQREEIENLKDQLFQANEKNQSMQTQIYEMVVIEENLINRVNDIELTMKRYENTIIKQNMRTLLAYSNLEAINDILVDNKNNNVEKKTLHKYNKKIKIY